MTMPHQRFRRLTILLLVLLLPLMAACGNRDDGDDSQVEASDVATIDDDTSADGEPVVSEDAPDPLPVETDELEIIERWQEAGVPRFRDGEELDFEPHASRIENGGTLLLDGGDASEEEVIAFYRGALEALGWQERLAGSRELSAHSDIASLLIAVNIHDGGTHILLILTDYNQPQ